MTTNFQQTDTAAGATNDQCSGNTSSSDTDSNQCAVGGSVGSVEQTHTPDNLAADLNGIWMEVINIDDYDGASGNWTTRLNVTTANHQITLDEIHICHVDSGYTAKNTLGSLTAIGASLSSTGVQEHVVNQGSGITIAAGDLIIIIYAFDNAQAMPQAIGYTPDQITIGPGTISGVGIGIPIAMYHHMKHNLE